MTISLVSLKGAYDLIDRALSAIGSLPGWLKLLLAAAIAGVIAHPSSREKLIGWWTTLREEISAIFPAWSPLLETVAQAYFKAKESSDASAAEIRGALPGPRARSAIQHARLVFLASKEPLSIKELLKRMRADGFTAEAPNVDEYLVACIKTSGQFVETSQGKWAFRVGDAVAAQAPFIPAKSPSVPAFSKAPVNRFTPPLLAIPPDFKWPTSIKPHSSGLASISVLAANRVPASRRPRKKTPARRRIPSAKLSPKA